MKLTNGDRAYSDWLYRLFQSAAPALVLIRPETLVARIDLVPEAMRLEPKADAQRTILGVRLGEAIKPELSVPIQRKRRSHETRLVVGGQNTRSERDDRLVGLVTHAHRWARQPRDWTGAMLEVRCDLPSLRPRSSRLFSRAGNSLN